MQRPDKKHRVEKKLPILRSYAAATAFPAATETATEILRAGGNAIDAAVAAAWTLAVCEPAGSGIGGQTSIMVRLANGEIRFVDGHSYAPAQVSRASVSRPQQRTGFRACVIPSTVAALEFFHARFGALCRASVLAPAINYAANGFVISGLQKRQANWCLKTVADSQDVPGVLRRSEWQRRRRMQQPELARTLSRLADYGAQTFYRGKMAHEIAEDMQKHDGLLTANDLSSFRLPGTRQPIRISYRGFEIVTSPPPGGGLQLLLALKLLQRLLPTGYMGCKTEWYVAVAQAIHAAFEERERFPIHPDDFTPTVSKWSLCDMRCDEIAGRLVTRQQLSTVHAAAEEPGETTHLCVADSEGNVVSLTQSIQSLFGAKVCNTPLGFIYNNYLTTCPRYHHPYQLRSHCLPRSNVAPTLVLKDGQVVLALGAAGSRRIVSSVVQIISRVIDCGMPVAEAMAAPRIHALLDGSVWLERPAATPTTMDKLTKLFKKVVIRGRHSFAMGCSQAIARTRDGRLLPAADPRRDGTAGGL